MHIRQARPEDLPAIAALEAREIGRASCRERVYDVV